ncbi:MAG TPA: Rid family hydrolase [Armatimonadota bacterium]|jgi:enamine deaminase RidA (YjgF/YER057c/UK114 family)
MSGLGNADVAEQVAVREIAREGARELFLTQAEAGPEGLAAGEAHLEQGGARVVFAELFTGEAAGAVAPELPATWVCGAASGPGWGGLQLAAVSGAEVRPVVLEGRAVGSVVVGPYATECRLSGLYPPDLTATPEQQARAAFERLEQALEQAGLDFSHVARTWLFLDDILGWYGEFNHARTTFFTERGVFDGLVPASTGIGGGNPAGAALVVGAYAIQPHHPGVTVQVVPSPLQCPAPRYGSSFSRAVEVAMPDLRRLFVSGTASIAPGGETQHGGDVRAQTVRTLEVIAAILESRGMGWADVTRATAYVRFPEDREILEEVRRAEGLPPLPVLVAAQVICRDDLLFELEVDAVQAR